MPIDPGTAQIVSAGLSGFLGAIGNRAARKEQRRWNLQQQANWENQFYRSVQARVSDAKAAGISPLAAMGISGSALPSFNTSAAGGHNPMARGIAAALQQVGIEKEKAITREHDAKALEAYTKSLQNQAFFEMLKLRLRRASQPSVAAATQISKSDRPDLGMEYYDEKGNDWQLLHPEAAESVEGFGPLMYALWKNVPRAVERIIGGAAQARHDERNRGTRAVGMGDGWFTVQELRRQKDGRWRWVNTGYRTKDPDKWNRSN